MTPQQIDIRARGGIGLSWLGVIAYVRVGRPWWMLRRPYDVMDVRPERGDAWTVVVQPRGHQGFRYHPGDGANLLAKQSRASR